MKDSVICNQMINNSQGYCITCMREVSTIGVTLTAKIKNTSLHVLYYVTVVQIFFYVCRSPLSKFHLVKGVILWP